MSPRMSRRNDYENSARRTVSTIVGRQQSVLRQWIPLGITILAVTVGISAWIWSERITEDEGGDSDDNNDGEENWNAQQSRSGGYEQTPSLGVDGASRSRSFKDSDMVSGSEVGDINEVVHMSGTAHQISNLRTRAEDEDTEIADNDKIAYQDHHTWEEEAELRASAKGNVVDGNVQHDAQPHAAGNVPKHVAIHRKTVAIVLSAPSETSHDEDDHDYMHTSLLSHLPRDMDLRKARIFVLIFAPGFKRHPLDISKDDESTSQPAFDALWIQAQAIVEKETMVFPFVNSTSYVQILRQLKPDYVYLQDSLAGEEGHAISQIQTWLRKDLVLVVGLDPGDGGLADSDSEESDKQEPWWKREDSVGHGKGVVVVDGSRLGDDFARRIYGEVI